MLAIAKNIPATLDALEPLLDGIISPLPHVRTASVMALKAFGRVNEVNEEDLTGVIQTVESSLHFFHVRLCISRGDMDRATSETAIQVWQTYGKPLGMFVCMSEITPLLCSPFFFFSSGYLSNSSLSSRSLE